MHLYMLREEAAAALPVRKIESNPSMHGRKQVKAAIREASPGLISMSMLDSLSIICPFELLSFIRIEFCRVWSLARSLAAADKVSNIKMKKC